jgi:glycosyltransferase involved in cell wall biosynthesis
MGYGGCRRFLELGNEFTKMGHEWTIYTINGSNKCNWFEFYGIIKPLNINELLQKDTIIIGDATLLRYFDYDLWNYTGLKIMYVVSTSDACNYINIYTGHLRINDPCFISVFCSSTAWEFYKQFVTLDPDRHFLIPGGVNTKTFYPIPSLRPEKETILFYSCADMPRKGHDIIFNEIKDLGYDMITFSRLPTNLKHPDLIEFNDVENSFLSQIYNRASLLIHHERGSGWSNTAAEAMACKLPVITNGNGSSDFAIDIETAIVTSNIRHGLQRYQGMCNDELELMISKAREKIQEFSWFKVADKLEKLIKEKL